jgi:phosphatidylglycerophosphate synthase
MESMQNSFENPNKLPKHLENPIDVWILEVCEKMDPLFVKWNMTPNKLTTISLYFGLLTVYCLHKRIKYLPGIFYFISYIFDGADGQYARKHNMVSKFGDYYDHLKDWTIMILIIYILYSRKNKYLFIFSFISFFSISHIGCQEHYYIQNNPDKEHSETLSFCKYFCPLKDDLDRAMSYTKYVGLGTINLLISIILFFA